MIAHCHSSAVWDRQTPFCTLYCLGQILGHSFVHISLERFAWWM